MKDKKEKDVVRIFCEERDKEIERLKKVHDLLEPLSRKCEKRKKNFQDLQEFRDEVLEVL